MKYDRILVSNRVLPITGNATGRYTLERRRDGAWGISVTILETGERAFAEDVTRDGDLAARIWRLMTEGRVTPVAFFDVLYDQLP